MIWKRLAGGKNGENQFDGNIQNRMDIKIEGVCRL